jgi:hypothetical protein
MHVDSPTADMLKNTLSFYITSKQSDCKFLLQTNSSKDNFVKH